MVRSTRRRRPRGFPRRSGALVAVALLATGSPAPAQDVRDALERWRGEHGPGWRAEIDEGTGAVELLHGGSAPATLAPREESEWFALARQALAGAADLHRIEAETLLEDRALFLPLGMVGSSDKITVRFRQAVRGVPVEHGSANVLFDARGRLLAIQTRALPDVASLAIVPSIGSASAAAAGRRAFAEDAGREGTLAGAPELVIAQLERAEQRVPLLGWLVTAQRFDEGSEPEGFTYLVDARTGAIARRESSIHRLDVGGTVSTMATRGLLPDGPANPEAAAAMPHARVQSAAGTVYADADGVFVFPGLSGPLTCTFAYQGRFADVRDASGTPYSLALPLGGTGNAALLNPASADALTSQANAYRGIHAMRDWIRSVNPFDPAADFVRTAFCNVSGGCNAFFSGVALHFHAAQGNCWNMAWSTMVAHEDGHWLNVRYGIGNPPAGMGEGSADVFATYLHDDRHVAANYYGNGLSLRDGETTRQFCGDCCGPCHGGFHNDGEVFLGAAWKVRRNLGLSLGDGPGDALADALFLGWHNAFDQTEIESLLPLQWLALDDDDGNLHDGTPHFDEIDLAFREQGFPAVQLEPIAIVTVPLPDTDDEIGPYLVTATVSSNVGAPISQVHVHHRGGPSGPYAATPLNGGGATTWSGMIPGYASPAAVDYYFVASDAAGNAVSFPPGGAPQSWRFAVGRFHELFADDFEVDRGWTASPGFQVGAWTRVDPNGTTVLGGPAQTEDDHTPGAGTRCFVTGQAPVGAGPNVDDVDLGPRTLTSPTLPLPYATAELRYACWMFSSSGDDLLRVEVSIDGGPWTQEKAHTSGLPGWREDRVLVTGGGGPGSTVAVRFSASDPPNNSVTEAAVDDVSLAALVPTACSPVPYCTAKLDANGCEPAISAEGFASLSGSAPMRIEASGVSGARNGLLFYGHGAQAAPFRGGWLCCAPPLRRTPLQPSGGAPQTCDGRFGFDFAAHVRSGVDPLLTAGRACAAQYFYRDPLGTHATGLTDAVSFTICP
jgi:hypothetical protein